MSNIIHNVAVDPASSRPWKWRGDLGVAPGRGFRAEVPAGCSEVTDEPQDLDFPLAPFRLSGAPWALSKWFYAV